MSTFTENIVGVALTNVFTAFPICLVQELCDRVYDRLVDAVMYEMYLIFSSIWEIRKQVTKCERHGTVGVSSLAT